MKDYDWRWEAEWQGETEEDGHVETITGRGSASISVAQMYLEAQADTLGRPRLRPRFVRMFRPDGTLDCEFDTEEQRFTAVNHAEIAERDGARFTG